MKNAFIDWLTASQFHPKGGLPIVSGGLTVHYDAGGIARFERNCATKHLGSFETSINVSSDGYRVYLSGNVGRFQRSDNLYGFGFERTIELANEILNYYSLPPFTAEPITEDITRSRPCYISRLDFTINYATGSEKNARDAIRFLSSSPIHRVKKGIHGTESFWFANTRKMFKAYIKHLELLQHGKNQSDPIVKFCQENGILRIELELKKRLLWELGMNTIDTVTDDKLIQLYEEETSFARKYQVTSDSDLLELLPPKTRIYAQSWLSGNDLTDIASRATLFRHAKILREHGIDILTARNVKNLVPQIRFIDLVPAEVPDWYIDMHRKTA